MLKKRGFTIIKFECSMCERTWLESEVLYTCPKCDANLIIHNAFEENPNLVQRESILNHPEHAIWRYAPLLPVPDPGFSHTPLHKIGFSPVYQSPRLAKAVGLERLWIKDDSLNPSGSFKDRSSAIVMARAIQRNTGTTITASTGNAGAAMACVAASCGSKAIILAPRTAPPAKIAQLLCYGAQVILVDGSYDDAFDLSVEASKTFGWYNRNTGYNPFTAEGKKTAAFEIWEQVLRHLPSQETLHVFVPVGDGNIISGVAKGFQDLLRLGWIESLPKLIGVQAEGSAAIANAWAQNADSITAVQAHTIADSISVNLPRDGMRALKSVRQSQGFYITVSDEEILNAITMLGTVGIFAEPAAAAAFAGLKKASLQKQIDPGANCLVLNTGNGLKDINAAVKATGTAPVIEPTIKDLKELIHV